MPNWCMNSITFHGPKPKIAEFADFLTKTEGKDWFDFFIKPPAEIANDPSGRYSWNVETYGCKWNCDVLDGWSVEDDDFDADKSYINFSFDSPWSPPIELYRLITTESELSLHANYHEEGMGFLGEFVDGQDECYEYQDLDDVDDIPEHIVEFWDLRTILEDRMEMDDYDQDDDDDDDDTVADSDDIDDYKLPPHTD